MKGLLIKNDLWGLISVLTCEESHQLMQNLSCHIKGEPLSYMSGTVKYIFERIVNDNEKRAKVSEKRKTAAEKRWENKKPEIVRESNIIDYKSKLQSMDYGILLRK